MVIIVIFEIFVCLVFLGFLHAYLQSLNSNRIHLKCLSVRKISFHGNLKPAKNKLQYRIFYLPLSVNTNIENDELNNTIIEITKTWLLTAHVENEIEIAMSMIIEGPKDLQNFWVNEENQLREKGRQLREKRRLLLDKLDKLEDVTRSVGVNPAGSCILAYYKLKL